MLIKHATPEDRRFLEEMFVQAALWREHSPRVDLAALLQNPELVRYFRDWGRQGDHALIASTESGTNAGAAWFRLFSEHERGYGYVRSDIPELGIAVARPWRGRGVGRALIVRLQDAARELGYAGLSLSVHPENPAIRLYESVGFERHDAEPSAVTMLWSVD